MSSETPIPPSGSFYLSPEKCREMWGDIDWDSGWEDIPEEDVEILKERTTRYCEAGVVMTPFEEFEKELFELLMKG